MSGLGRKGRRQVAIQRTYMPDRPESRLCCLEGGGGGGGGIITRVPDISLFISMTACPASNLLANIAVYCVHDDDTFLIFLF